MDENISVQKLYRGLMNRISEEWLREQNIEIKLHKMETALEKLEIVWEKTFALPETPEVVSLIKDIKEDFKRIHRERAECKIRLRG